MNDNFSDGEDVVVEHTVKKNGEEKVYRGNANIRAIIGRAIMFSNIDSGYHGSVMDIVKTEIISIDGARRRVIRVIKPKR